MIIKISLFLSCAYFAIQFIDNVFLFKKNLGDEWFFTRDLNYFLANGYDLSVINGISIPFTLFSSFIYSFLNDISISLRIANAIIVFLLILYLFVRKNILATNDKKIFIIHLLMLIGTTGGLFYGTNESFIIVSLVILFSESYIYLCGKKPYKIIIIIASSICVLARPHFIIYLIPFIVTLMVYLYIKNRKIRIIIFNPVITNILIGFIVAILFNYPRISGNSNIKIQDNYLPPIISLLSYCDKSGTSKTQDPDFSWVEWVYFSQKNANAKGLGLFAPLVSWEVVRDFKKEYGTSELPNSYQDYLINYIPSILERFPMSIIETLWYSIRYVGIFLWLLPFWLYYRLKGMEVDSSTFISLVILGGLATWAIIWPTILQHRWLSPYYIMLLIIFSNKSSYISNVLNQQYIILNIVIMDIITIWALWKWEIFLNI